MKLKVGLFLLGVVSLVCMPNAVHAQFGRSVLNYGNANRIINSSTVRKEVNKIVNTAMSGGSTDIVIEKIPENMDEFMALKAMNLSNPRNTGALFVVMLCAGVKDLNLAYEMMDVLNGPKDLSNYERQFLRDRIGAGGAYLGNSYFKGTSPKNSYTPSLPLTITVYGAQPQAGYPSSDYCRIALSSSGADSKRHIMMRRKGNNWYVWDYPAVVSGIRTAAAEDPWSD